jgi:hypothetical protein
MKPVAGYKIPDVPDIREMLDATGVRPSKTLQALLDAHAATSTDIIEEVDVYAAVRDIKPEDVPALILERARRATLDDRTVALARTEVQEALDNFVSAEFNRTAAAAAFAKLGEQYDATVAALDAAVAKLPARRITVEEASRLPDDDALVAWKTAQRAVTTLSTLIDRYDDLAGRLGRIVTPGDRRAVAFADYDTRDLVAHVPNITVSHPFRSDGDYPWGEALEAIIRTPGCRLRWGTDDAVAETLGRWNGQNAARAQAKADENKAEADRIRDAWLPPDDDDEKAA